MPQTDLSPCMNSRVFICLPAHRVPSFTRHRRHTLLVNDVADIVSGRNLRESSPFLHAVCCLNGFRYSKDEPVGSALHRELYEHVRRALGQVLLASPLPIPELYAVLIMCLFGSAPTVRFSRHLLDTGS